MPGVLVSELLPNHARLLDKMSIIRSLHHDTGDHFAAAHWMLTGYFGSTSKDLPPQYPSAGSIIAKLKGARKPGMPAYVGLPNTHSVGLVPGYHGAAYLGVGYNPFVADGDPNSESYQVPNLTLPAGVDASRVRRSSRVAGCFRPYEARRRCIGPDGRPRSLRPGSLLLGPRRRRSEGVRPEQGGPPAPRPLLAASMGAERRCWRVGWSRRACGS